jgi:hypothetical protein
MPGPPRSAGDGIAEATGLVRPSCAEPAGTIADEASMLMEQVVCRENMLAAYQRVVRNKGAAGVDGMTVDQLADFCEAHWEGVREQLLNGTYRPQPVREVQIPKPNGGVRTLGIPTVLDRLIQQALHQVLCPIFDPTFSQHSYGFRPGRSPHQAVQAARDHIAAGHRWVVDMDLEKFFDRVNHDVLMARVGRRVKDRRVIVLIYRYLRSGMMAGGLISPRSQGTPPPGRAAHCLHCCRTTSGGCWMIWTRSWSVAATASCVTPTTATSMCGRSERASGCLSDWSGTSMIGCV